MELDELVDVYVNERQGLGFITAATATDRRRQLRLMLKGIPTTDPNEVTPLMLRAWLATSTSGQPLAPRSIALRAVVARHFFAWCANNDHIDKSPARTLEAPRIRPSEPRSFDTKEVRRLTAVIDKPRDLAIVLLMVQCGLRRCEIRALDVDDLDMQTASLGVKGKGYRGEISRYIPIPAEAAVALHAWLAVRPSADALFPTRHSDRISLSLISRTVSDLMRECGIKKASFDGRSGHALRHTFAQSLVDRDVPIRVVMTAMGHQNQATSERYANRKMTVLADALEGRKYVA